MSYPASWKVLEIKSFFDAFYSPLPHFEDAEKHIFAAWVEQYQQYGTYAFDVPVMSSAHLAEVEKFPPGVKEAAFYLTGKKIDALKILNHDVWIIEVKKRPLASGVGQLLVYQKAFEQTYPDYRVRKLVYVVPIEDMDVRMTAESMGISFQVVKGLEKLATRWVY
jgi:hypothetical protein